MMPVLQDTLLEMRRRKVLYVVGVVTALAVLIISASRPLEMKTIEALEGVGRIDLAIAGLTIAASQISFYLLTVVALLTFAVSGLFPSMLRKGSAHFYLTKPTSRSSLFYQKYFSLLVSYGGVLAIGGIIVGLVSTIALGFFGVSVLWVFVGRFLEFFILFALIAACAVWTGSGGTAAMITFCVWITQFFLWGLRSGGLTDFGDSLIGRIGSFAYYILPKFASIEDLFGDLAVGKPVTDWLPVWSSLLFAGGCLWLGSWVFQRKEY